MICSETTKGHNDTSRSSAAVYAEKLQAALMLCVRQHISGAAFSVQTATVTKRDTMREGARGANLNGSGSEHHIMSQSSNLGHVCSHDPAAEAAAALSGMRLWDTLMLVCELAHVM